MIRGVPARCSDSFGTWVSGTDAGNTTAGTQKNRRTNRGNQQYRQIHVSFGCTRQNGDQQKHRYRQQPFPKDGPSNCPSHTVPPCWSSQSFFTLFHQRLFVIPGQILATKCPGPKIESHPQFAATAFLNVPLRYRLITDFQSKPAGLPADCGRTGTNGPLGNPALKPCSMRIRCNRR